MKKLIYLIAVCFISLECYAQPQPQPVPCPRQSQLFTKEKAHPFFSRDIDSNDIRRMIANYNNCPIQGLDKAKGFILDEKIIEIIRHDTITSSNKIESIYLYLGKRDTLLDNDASYTVIAIPAYKIDTNTHLIIEKHKNFEWHDLISNHPVRNDRFITSQNQLNK